MKDRIKSLASSAPDFATMKQGMADVHRTADKEEQALHDLDKEDPSEGSANSKKYKDGLFQYDKEAAHYKVRAILKRTAQEHTIIVCHTVFARECVHVCVWERRGWTWSSCEGKTLHDATWTTKILPWAGRTRKVQNGLFVKICRPNLHHKAVSH